MDNQPNIVRHPLTWYTDRILAGEVFTFSRWGDGEWRAVLKPTTPGQNCDGHRYWTGMCRQLIEVLARRPSYILGMQSMAVRMWKHKLTHWLSEHGLQDVVWHNSDVFHHASIARKYEPLMLAMRSRPVVLVGPNYLQRMKHFPVAAHITVPRSNCYLKHESTLSAIRKACRSLDRPIVSLSMGPSAELVLDDLYSELGNRAWLIDFGSLWDPFVGVATRRYHRKLIGRRSKPPRVI